jgi:hypothetical protein
MSNMSYKACLHAAIENPAFTNFTQAQAACATLTTERASSSAGEQMNPLGRPSSPAGEQMYPLGPGGQHLLGPGGQHLLGPGGQHLLGPGGQHLLGPGGQHLLGPGGQHLLGPGGQQQYYSQGLPYVPALTADPLRNELSSPFQSSGGVLWRDDPNIFNQFDPFGTASPLFTYSSGRGGRFSQFYTNGLF